MANGMSSLMVGASGLKTAQAALNTTAHNLSNINTEGYTRQQIGFTDTQYMSLNTLGCPVSSTCGMGVSVHEIRRLRNTFIDSAYRTENGRYGYYNSQYKAVVEIEDLFGEMQGVTYQDSMTGLCDAINELSKEPSSTVKRSSLMQSASAFMTRSDAVYQGLTDYQQTLNEDVKNMVDTINDIANKIYSLNKEVAKIEAAGQETANDLRDQRDSLLDELSEYMRISYYENENGETMVQAESVPLVTGTSVTTVGLRTSDSNNLYIPVFEGFDCDVYSENALYGTSGTDQGSLKGLLLARGCVTVDYTDIPVKPEKVDQPSPVSAPTTAKPTKVPDRNDYTDDASYETAMNDYNNAMDEWEEYEQYQKDLQAYEDYQRDYAVYEQKQAYYNKYIEPSAILCAIAGIDKLVNGICTTLNEVLCPTTTEAVDADGNQIYDFAKQTSVLTNPNTGKDIIPDSYEYMNDYEYMYDAEGNKIKGADYAQDVVNDPTNKVKYYTSTEKLYYREEATGTQDANGQYTYTSSQEKLYNADGEVVYGAYLNDGTGNYSYTYDSKLYENKEATPTYYNYSILDMNETDYGNDDDRTTGEGIFTRINTEDFVTVSVTTSDGSTKDYRVHNNANTNGMRSNFQLGNTIMDPDTSQNVALLAFTTLEGKEDMSRGQDLLDAWYADFASLNPESYSVGSFDSYYNNFTSDFATIGDVLYNFVDQQQTMITGYDNQRQQTTGVSSDDELQKMIKYQQSYNAASRYINVVSEMLEHLVTSLGNA